jgi:glycosyltransferase involved in cell wall biosynthesis
MLADYEFEASASRRKAVGGRGSGQGASRATRSLWIEWGDHLRSKTLSLRLGVTLEEISAEGGTLWRYLRSVRKTIATVGNKRPDVVIATNPSIVLGLLLLLLREWYGFKLVSDAHHCGVKAFNDSRLLQRFLDFHNARADVVIVTNENHARVISSLGTQAYICQDPLPVIPNAPSFKEATGRSVLLICSFDVDEPYEAVFEAFSSLQQDGFTLYVSGNYKKARTDLSRFSWVRLLGFLPREEYYRYLLSATIVMDLTTRDDCLLCGAYEALAAEKPLILSRTTALEEYFGSGVVLTDNTSEAITESVRCAYARRDELAQRAKAWVAQNNPYMNERIAGLHGLVEELHRGH